MKIFFQSPNYKYVLLTTINEKFYKNCYLTHGEYQTKEKMKSSSNFQDTFVILQVKSNLQSQTYFKQQCRSSFILLSKFSANAVWSIELDKTQTCYFKTWEDQQNRKQTYYG